jgi:hypothetical protein
MDNKRKCFQHLTMLYLEDTQRKYPNYPTRLLALPKYTDKTANGLTKCIVHFLNLNGHQAERISNTGRQLDNRKSVVDVLGRKQTIGSCKWIKGSGTNGTADISATIYGLSIKVEVKIGMDKQSNDQKLYQEQIESAGGVYIIAKSFEQFYCWYMQKFV